MDSAGNILEIHNILPSFLESNFTGLKAVPEVLSFKVLSFGKGNKLISESDKEDLNELISNYESDQSMQIEINARNSEYAGLRVKNIREFMVAKGVARDNIEIVLPEDGASIRDGHILVELESLE